MNMAAYRNDGGRRLVTTDVVINSIFGSMSGSFLEFQNSEEDLWRRQK